MKTVKPANKEKGKVRAKVEATIQKAKEAYGFLEKETSEAVGEAAEVIREQPFLAVGLAFGLGLLIGVLAMQGWHH